MSSWISLMQNIVKWALLGLILNIRHHDHFLWRRHRKIHQTGLVSSRGKEEVKGTRAVGLLASLHKGSLHFQPELQIAGRVAVSGQLQV